MPTEPYIFGVVDGVRTDQAERITNAKLNQTADAVTEKLAAVAQQTNQFAQDNAATGGLTWAHLGGTVRAGLQVLAGSVSLVASATNYVEIDTTTGVVSVNQTGFTATKVALHKLVCDGGSITTNSDSRTWVVGGAIPWGNVTSVPTGTTTNLGVLMLAADGNATAGRAAQASDTRMSDSRAPKILQMADSAAAVNTLYYSTDLSKLVYKDPAGVANPLY